MRNLNFHSFTKMFLKSKNLGVRVFQLDGAASTSGLYLRDLENLRDFSLPCFEDFSNFWNLMCMRLVNWNFWKLKNLLNTYDLKNSDLRRL
jgi:hypothetical protein